MASETVTLTRDCDATAIPAGTKVFLPEGSTVTITQTLGGSFTVVTDHGYMVRIESSDAEALGKEAYEIPVEPPADAAPPATAKELEDRVWEELKTVFDPEIPVNVVDLGLIFRLDVTGESRPGYEVEVDMTMTAPGCGMGDVLTADAAGKIERLPGVLDARVNLVWEPAWDQSLMSDAARLQLGMD